MADDIPPGGYYTGGIDLKGPHSFMTPRPSYSLRPRRAAPGMQWLVLLVFKFGAVVSAMGGIYSHGIAAIMAADQATPTSPSHDHARAPDDGEWPNAGRDATVDHPHHGADHSHDKAHDLPAAWIAAVPQLHAWLGRVRPWIGAGPASRLEGPPMG